MYLTTGFEPEYVQARKALLDVLEALGKHREAVVLVGAQAIYLRTGESDLAVAPYTTDADLMINSTILTDKPLLEEVLEAAGFKLETPPGAWKSSGDIAIDFMVPESLSGQGRRGADLGNHGRRVARRTLGLEAALVDQDVQIIGALEDTDTRKFEIRVAEPGALLIAKLYKIEERIEKPHRLSNKDALDVYRLLRETSVDTMAATMKKLLADKRSQEITEQGIRYLEELFTSATARGAAMAGEAAHPLVDSGEIAASSAALAKELLVEILEN